MMRSSLWWSLIALPIVSGLILLAWWGWHTLDPSMLLLGSQLC